ncbi:MAG: hypothetical protein WAQ98_13755 [Blastocatellia bacterium]
MSEKNKPDAFQQMQTEIAQVVQEVITDYLLPLQTKKISKKMIEQMSVDCANQIASKAVVISRKNSTNQTSKLTSELASLLNEHTWKAVPLFNDKLTALVGKMTPEEYERIKTGVANQVVSQVYKSISDFANALGIKISETSANSKEKNS